MCTRVALNTMISMCSDIGVDACIFVCQIIYLVHLSYGCELHNAIGCLSVLGIHSTVLYDFPAHMHKQTIYWVIRLSRPDKYSRSWWVLAYIEMDVFARVNRLHEEIWSARTRMYTNLSPFGSMRELFITFRHGGSIENICILELWTDAVMISEHHLKTINYCCRTKCEIHIPADAMHIDNHLFYVILIKYNAKSGMYFLADFIWLSTIQSLPNVILFLWTPLTRYLMWIKS